MPALATVAGKSFNGKFTAKIFLSGIIFMLPLLMPTVEVSSFYYIIWYLYHMLVKFEQNRMVWTIQNFEIFDKNWLIIFWQSVDALLEDVSVTETIV